MFWAKLRAASYQTSSLKEITSLVPLRYGEFAPGLGISVSGPDSWYCNLRLLTLSALMHQLTELQL